jgi:hypothetical protein
MSSTHSADAERLQTALGHLSDDLLRRVAGKLFRPRINQPADEILEKLVATYANPPVIDRTLNALTGPARTLLALLGRSRQTHWRIHDLLAILAALGAEDAFLVVESLLHDGLLVADAVAPLDNFSNWYVEMPAAKCVLAPATVLARAAALSWTDMSELPVKAVDARRPPTTVDGLEWPIRLAIAWQHVAMMPVKLTNAGSLYKRDQVRFQNDAILGSPLNETGASLPDAGAFALLWARAAGQLAREHDELRAGPIPVETPLTDTLTMLFAALFAIDRWDPLLGAVEDREKTSFATAALLAVTAMAVQAEAWFSTADIAAWLWARHPHWSGQLPRDAAATQGTSWVDALMAAILAPLRVVDILTSNEGTFVRLGEFGRHLLAKAAAPTASAVFPQTLLVQPNAEVLVYRQGLTPHLAFKLTAFAQWKQLGAAGTMELTAESVVRGLAAGLTLGEIVQTLDRHGMKPVPANVADLIRRWADKRDRLSVYTSATLVEFSSAADLDSALSRGIVTVRLTDRIGLTATGADPEFANLKLIGNRDYDAKPQQCVVVADDGVTLAVDAAASDLLLDAELVKFAEPLPGSNGTRHYRMSRTSLQAAAARGMSADDLNDWCLARTGEPLPPAAKLLYGVSTSTPVTAQRLLVLTLPDAEIADGLVQWPETAPLIARRLGAQAIAVTPEDLPQLTQKLEAVGLKFQNET